MTQTIEKLVKLGFSEYESKAYIALLKEHPATGYQVAKISGIPRSMIYEVLGKLVVRGAALMLPKFGSTQYAPVPAAELFTQLQRDHDELVSSAREDLMNVGENSDLEYVWNLEGEKHIIAKAVAMISQAQTRIYLALLPPTFPQLQYALEKAVEEGIKVVLYSSDDLKLRGGRTVIAPMSEHDLIEQEGLGCVLVVDSEEALIGEQLTGENARASWTRSPLFVLIAEHHLRTDLYLPKILEILGAQAQEIIHPDDYELFAQAFESKINT